MEVETRLSQLVIEIHDLARREADPVKAHLMREAADSLHTVVKKVQGLSFGVKLLSQLPPHPQA